MTTITLTPQETEFVLQAIDAVFTTAGVRGGLDNVARTCALAISVRQKLTGQANGLATQQKTPPHADGVRYAAADD